MYSPLRIDEIVFAGKCVANKVEVPGNSGSGGTVTGVSCRTVTSRRDKAIKNGRVSYCSDERPPVDGPRSAGVVAVVSLTSAAGSGSVSAGEFVTTAACLGPERRRARRA